MWKKVTSENYIMKIKQNNQSSLVQRNFKVIFIDFKTRYSCDGYVNKWMYLLAWNYHCAERKPIMEFS